MHLAAVLRRHWAPEWPEREPEREQEQKKGQVERAAGRAPQEHPQYCLMECCLMARTSQIPARRPRECPASSGWVLMSRLSRADRGAVCAAGPRPPPVRQLRESWCGSACSSKPAASRLYRFLARRENALGRL